MPYEIKLAIEEEYGYQQWVAYLSQDDYEKLLARWATIKGLNCLVPVRLIIPQAELAFKIEDINIWMLRDQKAKRCHIHEEDDSFLEGSHHLILADTHFSMDGKTYTDEEIEVERRKEQEYCAEVYRKRREKGE